MKLGGILDKGTWRSGEVNIIKTVHLHVEFWERNEDGTLKTLCRAGVRLRG